MSRTRLDMQHALEEISNGLEVIFQPPTGTGIPTNCIIYERVGTLTTRADNKPYNITPRYTVTRISKTQGENFIETMLNHFANCTHDRTFKSENCYHDVFTVYY